MTKHIQLKDSPSGNIYKVVHEGDDYYLYTISVKDTMERTWKVKKDAVVEVERPIKVGDKVRIVEEDRSDEVRDVLYIHHKDPKRKFIVVAYKSDIPEAFYENKLELVED
jgi:hypothetical protein